MANQTGQINRRRSCDTVIMETECIEYSQNGLIGFINKISKSTWLNLFMAIFMAFPLLIIAMYFLQSKTIGSLETEISDLGIHESKVSITDSSTEFNNTSISFKQPPYEPINVNNNNNSVSYEPPPVTSHLHPYGTPHYSFVHMNTYRTSPNSFFVIGITSVYVRRFGSPVFSCEWHPNPPNEDLVSLLSDPLSFNRTDAKILYISYDENRALYVPAIVNCTFNGSVGVDGYGGILAINVFVGGRDGKETRVIAKVEARGEAQEVLNATPVYKYAYCSPPINHVDRPSWFLQWLTYHHYMFEGKEHFFFYNIGGVTPQVRNYMAPFLDAGLVTIIDAYDEKQFPAWYHNQLLFINDCLYRTRTLANWTIFHDFDEFLDVQPPRTLSSLLEEYKDNAWINYGNVPASPNHCQMTKHDNLWPIERFLCRSRFPECNDVKADKWVCTSRGRRKYIVRAGRVVSTGVHMVSVPSTNGVNLNASIARVYHYRSTLSNRIRLCSIIVNTSQTQPKCFQDDSFSLRSQEARRFANNLLLPYNISNLML